MHYPKEYDKRAKKAGRKVIYHTIPYQNIKSVLCGYYFIYFLIIIIIIIIIIIKLIIHSKYFPYSDWLKAHA